MLEVTSPRTPLEPEPKPAPVEPAPAAVYTTNLKAGTALKLAHRSAAETMPLRKNHTSGFLEAAFAGDVHAFDIPNLALDKIAEPGTHPAKHKKKVNKANKKKVAEAAKAAKQQSQAAKKDAAAAKQEAKLAALQRRHSPQFRRKPAAAPAPQVPQPDGDRANTFRAMYYKNTTSIGIRLNSGSKPQILSFGGVRTANKSRDAMWEVGKKVVTLLENGSTYGEGKSEGQRLGQLLADVEA